MKVLSLFDGISCARVALGKAKIPVEKYYASEIDKYAIQVSQSNYPDIVQLGSVTSINNGGIGRSVFDHPKKAIVYHGIDLLIGGSPCQDLSIAKKDRKGLRGDKSGLFWEYVRILKEVKPKYFILENVASMPKVDKDIITEVMGVEPVMINAALVSAQQRKRLFWVGKKNSRGGYDQVKVEQPKDTGILLKDILESGDTDRLKSYCIDASYYKGANWQQYIEKARRQLVIEPVRVGEIGKGGQGDRIYSPNGKSVNLSANGGGRGAKTGLYAIPVALRNRGSGKKPEYNGTDKANSMTTVQTDSMVAILIPEATKKGYALAKEGDSVDLSFPNSTTRRGRVGEKVKNLMTSQNVGVVQNMVIRKLTPIECERLTGLKDNYTRVVSNTQRYRACGNAFHVDVVAHILKAIKKDSCKK